VRRLSTGSASLVRRIGLCLTVTLVTACTPRDTRAPDFSGPLADWPAFGAAPGGGHYSPATQITRDNVHRLVKAWEYRSGHLRAAGSNKVEFAPGQPLPAASSSWEMTPILDRQREVVVRPEGR
jgi:hypothetical protein